MRYAALFRGINVGGKNIVKMNELRQLLLELGLYKVKTYIQSGNAVFESDLNEASLRDEICNSFLKRFGIGCGIVIRNIDEIRVLIKQLPFATDEIASAKSADPEAEHLYVYFLNDIQEKAKIDEICEECDGEDILKAGKRELYLLCRQSIRKSKAAARVSKRFASATARNWGTVCGLFDMMCDMQDHP